ncbi:hypothetical protein Tco_0116967 [Tanacetum coccineum]
MEYCHKIIKGTLWNIPISPVMKNVIEQKITPTVEDLATDVDKLYRFLKEEMVEDLKYFNSLEKETKSLKSQLELQRTHTREPKNKVNQTVGTTYRETTASESTIQKPRSTFRKLCEHLVEIILFIVDSGYSKHMTGNLKLLVNSVEKFLGNDLLIGSCGSDLYSITLQETTSPNLICLMARATSS